MEDIDRVVNTDHHDPFSVLGMHQTESGVIVRAFIPDAAEIAVIDVETGKITARINTLNVIRI